LTVGYCNRSKYWRISNVAVAVVTLFIWSGGKGEII
jgi:hypothetical protein